MSVIALAAAGAAAAVLLVAVVVLGVTVRRLRRSTDARVSEAVGELSARTEAMVGELRAALEQARSEGRRSRNLEELGGSIDLDEVLDRVLRTAESLAGADAALVTVSGPTGPPVSAALGLSSEEAAAAGASALHRGEEEDGAPAGEGSIQGRVAVPVQGEAGPIGTLSVFTRSPSRRFDAAAVRELEELALRAGPAIDNARRFREARELADLDALTGLHNRRYFHETLAREIARARRYDRRLALVVIDVDDFKSVNDRIGHLAGDAVLAELAARLRSVVRSADVACRIGGDEFAVIIPEAGILDAQQLSRRLQAAVSSPPIGRAGRLEISAGVTEAREGDDAASLFERADEALYGAKEQGKGRVVALAASR